MSSLSAERTLKESPASTKKKVLNVIVSKSKKILCPPIEYDLLFSRFLRCEAERVANVIAEHKESKEDELTLIQSYHMLMGYVEKIKRIKDIADKWCSLTLIERLFECGLVHEYELLRTEIDDAFIETINSGEYGEFLSVEAKRTIEVRKSTEEKQKSLERKMVYPRRFNSVE